jgi:transposase
MRAPDMHLLQELVRLHRLGLGGRAVAKRLGISPNTERKYRLPLTAAGLLEGDAADLPELAQLKSVIVAACGEQLPATRTSSIEDLRDTIVALLDEGAGPTAIYDRLKLDPDFKGSLGAVKRLCARVSKAKGVSADDVAIRVETGPGEIAQVDFGYIGLLYDPDEGRMRKAWAFVMVLAFSRMMAVSIVFDQKIETWLRCHIEAFVELGGVPRVIVPDNLKAAVIRASFGIDSAAVINRSYRDFARYYGFQVDPTPVYSPKKKGKVESGVKYVKKNFIAARPDLEDVKELRAALPRWLTNVANARVHGTTRQPPRERFEREREHLLPPPNQPWQLSLWREAKVHIDTHVLVARATYSVPWRLIGKQVLARMTEHSVELYWEDTRVATHERQPPGGRSTIDSHLPEHRRDHRHRSRAFWEQRADELGEDVGVYIREIFDADDVLLQLRTVQAIVRHLAGFPADRAGAACRRASFYGLHTYGGIKNILRQGLDLEPLPLAVQRSSGALENPRFARNIGELLELPFEETDASN